MLKQSYLILRATNCGLPITESYKFDTELVSRNITELKRGKALDIDGLSAEHLQFCHPVLSVILQKLFNLMILMMISCIKLHGKMDHGNAEMTT